MNTYKFISSDEKVINIEFVIDGVTLTKTLDINYVPTDKEGFSEYCEKWIKAYQSGKAIENHAQDVSELSSIKGKAQSVSAEEKVA